MNAVWNDIVRKNAAGVVNAALRVLGNAADAEDVAQDVFVEAFALWPGTTNEQWAGLLARMAVCRALDMLRRKKKLEALTNATPDLIASDPCEGAVARELEERLRYALARLPSREAEVFCLHYYEHFAQSEIAERLGIARGAVSTALWKARHKLAVQLETFFKGCNDDSIPK